MTEIATIVAPVFGLILLGWIAARSGYVSAGSGRVVAEFAFKIAMPALLFRSMLSVGELPGSPMLLAAAYFLAALLVWVIATIATHVLLRRPAPDAAGIAMGATFSNSLMLGVPLALSAFGPAAAAPAALLISLDTPLLWIMATLHHAFAARSDAPILPRLGGVLLDLAKNPIILALAAGIAGRAGGLVVPELPDRMLALLQQAAVPSALTALGMSLATYEIKGQTATLTLICVLKLALFPIAAYVLAVHVFVLPPLWSAIAILFASMPVGANAYLFAARYERAVGSVSSAIAVSTVIAVVSVSAILYVLKAWVG